MVSTQNRLILWTGPKHCGKTTSASNLIQKARAEGFTVAGILEPSLYNNGELIGFDVLDLHSQKRTPLARRNKDKSTTGSFNFITDGLKFGNAVLTSEAIKSAELVIIDEFGPLEVNGQGWRRNIDSLLSSSNAIMLIIIRQELKDTFRRLYPNVPCLELEAIEESSSLEVITMIKNRSQSK
jgi:nucleoside-triphosphatase THEP1